MTMTPTLTKRAYESRILEVNLGPRMRATDSISAIDSITVDDAITISNETHSAAVVNFLTSGGVAGQTYPIRIRFSTAGTPTQSLEAIVNLVIVGEQ